MMVYKCLRIVDEVVVIDPGVATLMPQKKMTKHEEEVRLSIFVSN